MNHCLLPVSMSHECRFYHTALPEVEEAVLVQVKSLTEVGAYVTLLEYGRVEGMIQISEMSNRRIRSISKLTRVGNVEVCLVMRVDADRGYIDLSKKRVVAEEGLKAREQFARAKTVHGIMRHVSTITSLPLADVCGQVAWPLYKALGRVGAYEALRRAVNEGKLDSLFAYCEELKTNTPLCDALLTAAARKLTPHEVRVRAVFECTCLTAIDGVLAIKEALMAVKAQSDPSIILKLVSAPQFLIETAGIGREACTARVNEVLAIVQKEMTARGGNYKLRSPPDVIGDDEEEIPKISVDEDVSSDDEEEEEDGEKKKSDAEDSSSSSSSSSSDEEEEVVAKKKAHK